MANIKFTNFARTALAVGVGSGDVTMSVTGGTGALFPALTAGQYFYATLENATLDREIVKVTARAADTFTVARAQDNTTARTWVAGDIVSLRFVAAAISDAVVGTLLAANNLSDVGSAATARANLGALTAGDNIGAATATTPSPGDNSTKVATTAFVIASTPTVAPLQPITAAIASNAITITPSALSLDFRNSTLTNGSVTRVSSTPAALVIAATDSFGLVTAAGNQRIAILAINNAGTIELAASALAGGVSLDETGVITTATAATLGTHIKAANVRTGVAYRVIGFVDATFTTATGWGSLALVQGTGGQALAAMSSLGYGQTWQNVLGSRALGVNYYNTTGKPIVVCYSATNGAANISSIVINSSITVAGVQPQVGGQAMATAVIPVGASYLANQSTVGSSLNTWVELR